MARYFGWMAAVERHGEYTHDPVVMRCGSAVHRAFSTASSIQQVGPFNFFTLEQKDLGKLVMTTMQGQYGIEPDTIPYHEFKKHLASPPLSDSQAVKETLKALRSSDDAKTLPGRERLMEVQNHLVDQLVCIEKKLGYTLFPDERRKCGAPT